MSALLKTKQCATCGAVKALVLFNRNGNAPDGRMHECKTCQGKRSRGQRRGACGRPLPRLNTYGPTGF